MYRRVQTNQRRVCFFTRLTTDHGQSQVRFGVTRRPEAQIITSADSWLRIRGLLAADGYVFVDELSDDAGPASDGSQIAEAVQQAEKIAESLPKRTPRRGVGA